MSISLETLVQQLSISIERNDLNDVRTILFDHDIISSQLINSTDEDGFTALMNACIQDNRETVQLLISNGANIDTNGDERAGPRPLLFASYEGFKEIVELMLDNGANIEVKDDEGELIGSALVDAAGEGQEEIVKLLLDNGADIEAKNERKSTALQMAAMNGIHGASAEFIDMMAVGNQAQQQELVAAMSKRGGGGGGGGGARSVVSDIKSVKDSRR